MARIEPEEFDIMLEALTWWAQEPVIKQMLLGAHGIAHANSRSDAERVFEEAKADGKEAEGEAKDRERKVIMLKAKLVGAQQRAEEREKSSAVAEVEKMIAAQPGEEKETETEQG